MKITTQMVKDALELAERSMSELINPGICLACGETTEHGVEPDAARYECEDCGERAVMGVEQFLLAKVTPSMLRAATEDEPVESD